VEEEEDINRGIRNGTLVVSGRLPFSPSGLAAHNVRQRWIARGIWNPAWTDDRPTAFWRHEEPLELEQEWETDSDGGVEGWAGIGPGPKPGRRPKSDAALEEIRDRLLATIEAREASRPYRQFQVQLQEEKERLVRNRESCDEQEAQDIDAHAYNAIKHLWLSRGIWHRRWGQYPGMTWKHEEPFRLPENGDAVDTLIASHERKAVDEAKQRQWDNSPDDSSPEKSTGPIPGRSIGQEELINLFDPQHLARRKERSPQEKSLIKKELGQWKDSAPTLKRSYSTSNKETDDIPLRRIQYTTGTIEDLSASSEIKLSQARRVSNEDIVRPQMLKSAPFPKSSLSQMTAKMPQARAKLNKSRITRDTAGPSKIVKLDTHGDKTLQGLRRSCVAKSIQCAPDASEMSFPRANQALQSPGRSVLNRDDNQVVDGATLQPTTASPLAKALRSKHTMVEFHSVTSIPSPKKSPKSTKHSALRISRTSTPRNRQSAANKDTPLALSTPPLQQLQSPRRVQSRSVSVVLSTPSKPAKIMKIPSNC